MVDKDMLVLREFLYWWIWMNKKHLPKIAPTNKCLLVSDVTRRDFSTVLINMETLVRELFWMIVYHSEPNFPRKTPK